MLYQCKPILPGKMSRETNDITVVTVDKRVKFNEELIEVVVMEYPYSQRNCHDWKHHRVPHRVKKLNLIDKYVFDRYMKKLRKKNSKLHVRCLNEVS